MPRTAIPVNELVLNGALPSLTWVDADHVNEHDWTPVNKRDIILLQRGSTAGTNTYEVVSVDNVNGRPASAAQEQISSEGSGTPSVSLSIKGPFPTKGWAQTDGKIYVNNLVDAGADVRLAILRMPNLMAPVDFANSDAVPAGTRNDDVPDSVDRPENNGAGEQAEVTGTGGVNAPNNGHVIWIYVSATADSNVVVNAPADREGRVETIAMATSPGLEGGGGTDFNGVSVIGPLDPRLFNFIDGQVHITTSANRRCQAYRIAAPARL